MHRAKIGVVIPVYNGIKVLRKAVESVISQSLKDWELVIVNDGSIDGSGILADEFAQSDSRIKVLHQKNQGPYAARVNGLQLLSSEFFTSVDADDVIDSEMFERMYKLAVTESLDLVECDLSIATDNSGRIELFQTIEEIQENYFNPIVIDGRGFMCVCGKLYRNKILIPNGAHESFVRARAILFEDVLFNVQVLYRIKKIGRIHCPFYKYNINEFSSVRNFHPSSLSGFVAAVNARFENAKSYGVSQNDIRLSKWVVSNALNLIVLASTVPQKKWRVNSQHIEEILKLDVVQSSLRQCRDTTNDKKTILMLLICKLPSIFVVGIFKVLRKIGI